MPFKKYIVLFSMILATSGQSRVNACWWGTEFEDIRFILFNQDLLQNKSWWAFFHTSHYYFLNAEVKGTQDEQYIANEWKNTYQLNTPADSIETYLFGSLSNLRLRQHPFTKELDKHKSLKKYFQFAKECEAAISLRDPWDDFYTDELIKKRMELIPKAIQYTNREADDFLKKRYAFQLLRLTYYYHDPQIFNAYYNQYFGLGKEKTPIDWWATHYKSMMLERNNQMDSANYIHALVFNHCSNKMLASAKFFSDARLDSVLKLAKNDKEKADIYLMSEINEPGKSLSGIKQVYDLYPQHPLLPLLLVRETSKIENWIGTDKYNTLHLDPEYYYNDEPNIKNEDVVYLQQWYATVKQMPEVEKTQPAFYYLLMANLALLNTDAVNAQKYLDQVTPTDAQMEFQKMVLSTILITITEDITSAPTQQKLGENLDALTINRFNKFKSQNVLYSLFRLLEFNYRLKKQNHIAGLFHYLATDKLCYTCAFNSFEYGMISYFDSHGSIADVQAVINGYHKKDKTGLEVYLYKPYTHSYYYEDLLGTMYLREGEVGKALEVWKKIPESFWMNFENANSMLDEDPFSMNEYEGKPRTYPHYNKKQIAERLYQYTMVKNKTYTDWLMLGNAWFNFSMHGNSWFMLSYGWSNYATKADEHLSTMALNKSVQCYKNAMQLAKTNHEKTRVIYYLAFYYLLMDQPGEYKKWSAEYEKRSAEPYYQSVNCTLSKFLQNPKEFKEYFRWSYEND